MEQSKSSRTDTASRVLSQINEMWNNRPETLSEEWVDKFTKLVNNGGEKYKTRTDPRRQEPL